MVFADLGLGTLVQGAHSRIASISISVHTALGTKPEWTGHIRKAVLCPYRSASFSTGFDGTPPST